jgi:hypothetical protein
VLDIDPDNWEVGTPSNHYCYDCINDNGKHCDALSDGNKIDDWCFEFLDNKSLPVANAPPCPGWHAESS